MNQSLATLLAATLGAALSIAGGFFASLYSSIRADRLQRRQQVRNMLEQAYKHVQTIDNAYFEIRLHRRDSITDEDRKLISDALAKLTLLVEFYLPPLQHSLQAYRADVSRLLLGSLPDSRAFVTATRQMQASIVGLYRTSGYTYFPKGYKGIDTSALQHTAAPMDLGLEGAAPEQMQSSEAPDQTPEHRHDGGGSRWTR